MKKFAKKYGFVIGIVVSFIFLYLSLKNINFEEFLKYFALDKLYLLIIIFALNIVSRYVIAYRWYLLLGIFPKRNFVSSFNFINIGYFINNITPARIGDLLRGYLWSRKYKVSKTQSISSVLVERIFDMFGFALIFFLAIFILDLPEFVYTGGLIMIFLALIILILFFLTSFKKNNGTMSENKIIIWISDKFNKLSDYSAKFRNIRFLFLIFGSSLLIWILYVLNGYIIISSIVDNVDALRLSIISLVFISISFFLPSSPGNIGVYQYACILSFRLFGIDETPAVAFSVYAQFSVYVLSVILGLFSIYGEGLTIMKLKEISDKEAIDNESEENN